MYVYIKQDLTLNNTQVLICHQTQPNQTNRRLALSSF